MVQRKLILIGVVVTLSLGVLIWGVNFLKGINLFVSENVYYAVYKNVNGLVETGGVYLNGYEIGQVESIDLTGDNSGKLIARLLIEEDIDIPKGSVAEIYSVDIMGTQGIRIKRGKSKEKHQPGDTLKSSFNSGLAGKVEEKIGPVADNAKDLIKNLDTIVNKADKMVDTQTTKNINLIINNLASTTTHLNQVIKSEGQKLDRIFTKLDSFSTTLASNRKQLDISLSNISAISDSLKSADIKSTLSDINSITTSIDSGKGSLGKLVYNDTLYINLENASKELENLLKDIQKNPKKYVHFSIFGNK